MRTNVFEALTGYSANAVEKKIQIGAWWRGASSGARRTGISSSTCEATSGGSKVSNRRRHRIARQNPLRFTFRVASSAQRLICAGTKSIAGQRCDWSMRFGRGSAAARLCYPNIFPNSAGQLRCRRNCRCPHERFGDYAELYQKSLTKKAAATREDYRKILNLAWLPQLRDRVIAEIRYSELEDLISELSVASKTLNNYLSPLRGVFAYALKDHAIASNPAAGIENVPVQHPVPDPFEQAEVELILDDLAAREGPQVMNYFAAAFFAGFRPSEQIALVWSDVDFVRRNVRVQRGVVRGKAKDSTKTYRVRDVELSDRAWAAIDDQRAHTQHRWPRDLLESRHRSAVGRHPNAVAHLAALLEASWIALSRALPDPPHVRDVSVDGRREPDVDCAADGARQCANVVSRLCEVDRRCG